MRLHNVQARKILHSPSQPTSSHITSSWHSLGHQVVSAGRAGTTWSLSETCKVDLPHFSPPPTAHKTGKKKKKREILRGQCSTSLDSSRWNDWLVLYTDSNYLLIGNLFGIISKVFDIRPTGRLLKPKCHFCLLLLWEILWLNPRVRTTLTAASFSRSQGCRRDTSSRESDAH